MNVLSRTERSQDSSLHPNQMVNSYAGMNSWNRPVLRKVLEAFISPDFQELGYLTEKDIMVFAQSGEPKNFPKQWMILFPKIPTVKQRLQRLEGPVFGVTQCGYDAGIGNGSYYPFASYRIGSQSLFVSSRLNRGLYINSGTTKM